MEKITNKHERENQNKEKDGKVPYERWKGKFRKNGQKANKISGEKIQERTEIEKDKEMMERFK